MIAIFPILNTVDGMFLARITGQIMGCHLGYMIGKGAKDDFWVGLDPINDANFRRTYMEQDHGIDTIKRAENTETTLGVYDAKINKTIWTLIKEQEESLKKKKKDAAGSLSLIAPPADTPRSDPPVAPAVPKVTLAKRAASESLAGGSRKKLKLDVSSNDEKPEPTKPAPIIILLSDSDSENEPLTRKCVRTFRTVTPRCQDERREAKRGPCRRVSRRTIEQWRIV